MDFKSDEIIETLFEPLVLKSDQAHGWCQNLGARNLQLHCGRSGKESSLILNYQGKNLITYNSVSLFEYFMIKHE